LLDGNVVSRHLVLWYRRGVVNQPGASMAARPAATCRRLRPISSAARVQLLGVDRDYRLAGGSDHTDVDVLELGVASNGGGLNLYGGCNRQQISIVRVLRYAFGAEADRQNFVWKSGR
jgi:hypothetical protein